MAENSLEIELRKLLSGNHFQQDTGNDSGSWDANFDVDRQLVHSKFMFYEKVFLRPKKYVKRFYHKIYPLPVEDWEILEKIKLYEDFCTIEVKLEIRFQASLKYVENNLEILSKINPHIKSVYQSQLLSLIHKEIKSLNKNLWIENGLEKNEKKIARLATESLLLHNIQVQVLCTLKSDFKDFPQVQLTQENIYQGLLKKDYEVDKKSQQELFRQEMEGAKNLHYQKQLRLKQLEKDFEIERTKLALEAEHERLILIEKEGQQIEYLAIEKRLHIEKIEYENQLEEINFEAKAGIKQKNLQRQREIEAQEQITALNHQQQKLQTEIAHYEHREKQWNQAKERVYIEKQALMKKHRQIKN